MTRIVALFMCPEFASDEGIKATSIAIVPL